MVFGTIDSVQATDEFYGKKNTGFKTNKNIEDRIKEQKIQFFSMLTAQLKNQDPTQPFDTNQMTQNIFTMNMVEQQMETNKLLGNVTSSMEKSRFLESASYVGKRFVYDGDRVQVQFGEAKVEFELKEKPEGAVRLQLFKVDDGNRIIKKFEQAYQPRQGLNRIELNREELKLPDGVYVYQVVDDEDTSKALRIKKFANGRVNAVMAGDKEYVFEVNNEQVPLSKVLMIDNEEMQIEPTPMEAMHQGFRKAEQLANKEPAIILQNPLAPEVMAQPVNFEELNVKPLGAPADENPYLSKLFHSSDSPALDNL